MTVVNSATADFKTSSNVAEDAKGAAAVMDPSPSIVSAINGADAAESCCGLTDVAAGFSTDLASPDVPLDCAALDVDVRAVSVRGRFGTAAEVVADFETVEFVEEVNGESRYDAAGGGDDVTGRVTCGV